MITVSSDRIARSSDHDASNDPIGRKRDDRVQQPSVPIDPYDRKQNDLPVSDMSRSLTKPSCVIYLLSVLDDIRSQSTSPTCPRNMPPIRMLCLGSTECRHFDFDNIAQAQSTATHSISSNSSNPSAISFSSAFSSAMISFGGRCSAASCTTSL